MAEPRTICDCLLCCPATSGGTFCEELRGEPRPLDYPYIAAGDIEPRM
jgi:hypothetical protein